MNALRGKVAFVTGATSRNGRAVALSLARRGACIAAFDRWSPDGGCVSGALSQLQHEVEDMGVPCLPLYGNITSETDVGMAVAEAFIEFRRIDILFNDTDASASEWWLGESDDILCNKMWLAAHYVIPRMAKRGAGTIITCASVPHDGISGENFVDSWTLCGSDDLIAPGLDLNNIRINAIYPAVSSLNKYTQRGGWTLLSHYRKDEIVNAVLDLV
jgi:3-oxoacyl-[acyl-carrier protein] reductase